MTSFRRIVEILDASVGGPTTPVGFHGAFWRGVSRDQFVTRKIFGLPLVVVGDGAGSNLVLALRGQPPFGADVGVPSASFNRMPSGRPPVPPAAIAEVEAWIDAGCPENGSPVDGPLTWRRTNAPVARRHDDVYFLDPELGWAVNSDGSIIKSTDGGRRWIVQRSTPGVYLRCIGFADAERGWVGTLTPSQRLLYTSNGGDDWTAVGPWPDEAPVAVCGLSVVSDQVVYGSGTNRPSDVPGMIKTVDGGATWTAWDMTPHASILIDCLFLDDAHGWVVGGKADEPPPTTRDKVKPVVLETTDGGKTWTNRLAGQEADFPFGEWGWKIQFLDDQVGFVSLENFTDAAILKTTDGGKTWRRLKVNDPQGNANLEGIGFVDALRGWVGGWGSADFTTGYSSATVDGGENWRDANEIGRFLNRFRFLGDPVQVGYASGDTVYKYSSEPVAEAESLAPNADPARRLMPSEALGGAPPSIPIDFVIPAGTLRTTLRVWDWYGVDVGVLLDEVQPAAGPRTFVWDGRDAQGKTVPAGRYLVRATVDATSISSLLTVRPTNHTLLTVNANSLPRWQAPAAPRPPRLATLSALLDAPDHDLPWLRNALQVAIQLELATLPPYLTARWTVKDLSDPVAQSIHEIRGEEMLHFGLACNLLTAVGGTPLLADAAVVPRYPGPLPGGVRPDLVVSLRKLSREQAKVFMEIEYPQGGPVATAAVDFDTIGAFYSDVLKAFQTLDPPLATERQLSGPLGLVKVETLEQVAAAIELINLQGEGSAASPEESPGDLAHHYRFGEIHHGKRLIRDGQGRWVYQGDAVPLPPLFDMADVPPGGYQRSDVPDPTTWELISRFDGEYSEMLRQLQYAWTHGDESSLYLAIGQMQAMHRTGRELIQRPRPDGQGAYGPCFRYTP